jgi:hypothetical protein
LPSLLVVLCSAPATVLRVGPTQTFTKIDAALAVAAPGDLILVDPGTYPAFTVTTPVSIAPSSTAYSVLMGVNAPAISIAGTTSTVAIDGASISYVASNSPAISVQGCTGDVRLQNITVDKAANQPGTQALAAIEAKGCADLILERVSVSSSVQRNGSMASPDGVNDGLSAVRIADTQLLLRECTLVGYDAVASGLFGGDALRSVSSGALNPPSCWMVARVNTSNVLVAGSSSVNGGNCLHEITGGGPGLAPEACGPLGLFPGTGGSLAGGIFAINNDGGIVAPGISRAIPLCALGFVGDTAAAPVFLIGTTPSVGVTDTSGGGTACGLFMSIGSKFAHSTPGISGRVLLDPATLMTIGFGTTPAAFPVTVPANPALVGLQLTSQGFLFIGGGTFVTMPAMTAVR